MSAMRAGAHFAIIGRAATKQGDGQPLASTITVKGGANGFYAIKAEK